jgi:hypothetical protein
MKKPKDFRVRLSNEAAKQAAFVVSDIDEKLAAQNKSPRAKRNDKSRGKTRRKAA